MNKTRGGQRLQSGVAAIVILFMTACGGGSKEEKNSSNSFHLDCGPIEQRDQYLAPLPNRSAIRVIYNETEFDDEEISKIKAVLSTWNEYSYHHDRTYLFTLQRLNTQDHGSIKSATVCDFEGEPNSIILKRAMTPSDWTAAGLSTSSPGTTIRCMEDKRFKKQSILLAAKSSRVGGDEQFQSVLLHELGHAIGLDHSCDMSGSTAAGHVLCENVKEGSEIKSATMFPYLLVNQQIGYAETKNNLQQNDQERARCILDAR